MAKVHIVGCGGVGFYVCVALSRAGVDYEVWDDDNFEGGLGHMRLPHPHNPKTKKVDFLRGFISVSMGDTPSLLHREKFKGDGVQEGDLVVDCTDAANSVRGKFWKAAREKGARMLRVSYDGRNNVVAVAEGLPLTRSDNGGYTNIPTLALSLMAGGVGATVILRVLEGRAPERVEFQVSLDEVIGVRSEDNQPSSGTEDSPTRVVNRRAQTGAEETTNVEQG